MSNAVSSLDGDTVKAGLLMESAHSQQRMAEAQLEFLRAHTDGLDVVVRDEIRRTLIEEFQALERESRRAVATLHTLKRAVAIRWSISAAALAMLCAVLPVAIERWAAPDNAHLEQLRDRRDALTANLAQLKRAGAEVEWHRCGETQRLCVRVDRKAPVYGSTADYYVLKGY